MVIIVLNCFGIMFEFIYKFIGGNWEYLLLVNFIDFKKGKIVFKCIFKYLNYLI